MSKLRKLLREKNFLILSLTIFVFIIFASSFYFFIYLDRISVINSSQKYKVGFSGIASFKRFDDKISSLGLFDKNGLVEWVKHGNTGRYENTTVGKLHLNFVDEKQDMGYMLLGGKQPVVASYSLAVEGRTAYLTVHFDYQAFKELSEEEKTRLINREILMALFRHTNIGKMETQDYLEEESQFLDWFKHANINEVSYFVFK